jgi:hypothetical protein
MMAVFIVNPDGDISDLFMAEHAKIDTSMVESARSGVNINKFEKKQ